MLKKNNLYEYPPIERITHENGIRYYVQPDNGLHLPSVTTILDAIHKPASLISWRERVGAEKALQIKTEAANLGSLIHTHMENYIDGIPRPGGTNIIRQLGTNMADQIIARGLIHVDEVWGIETPLYLPEIYAGTTDLVGLHNGKPAIMDYKTTRKMKKASDIPHYFCQGVAYALAHNYHYGTDINRVVIFMVSRDLEFKEFVVEESDFPKWRDKWFQFLEDFINKYGEEQK